MCHLDLGVIKLDGVAPLITDPPPTTFPNLSQKIDKKKIKKKKKKKRFFLMGLVLSPLLLLRKHK